MEYTKGGWKAKKNALGTWTIQTELEHIGQIDRHFNAQLIAASPDLYEALKTVTYELDTMLLSHHAQEAYLIGKQAIAKVEGK